MRWTRAAAALGVMVLLPAAPATAGSGSDGSVTVTIPDAVLAGYDCQSAPLSLLVDVPDIVGWAVSVVAAPTGKSRLDAVAFSGRGPGSQQGELLLCPADSPGPWTATVSSRVLLTSSEFTVGFEVRKQQTTTALTRVRYAAGTVRVRGTVLTPAGLAGRAPLEVRGLRPNGSWKVLGHTAAGAKGVFRFAAPRQVRSVIVDYPGDAVTSPSRARMRAEQDD